MNCAGEIKEDYLKLLARAASVSNNNRHGYNKYMFPLIFLNE